MKILMRILVIVTAFAVTMGGIYQLVGASGSTALGRKSDFGPNLEEQGKFPDGDRVAFQADGFHPHGDRREFHGAGRGGFVWIFGFIKNIGVVGMMVALIPLPKNGMKKRRRIIAPTRS